MVDWLQMQVLPNILVPAGSTKPLLTNISLLCSTLQVLTQATAKPVEKLCHCAKYTENHQNQGQNQNKPSCFKASQLSNHSSYISLIVFPPLPTTMKHCSWICAITRSGLGRTTFSSSHHLQFNHFVSKFLSFYQELGRLKSKCGTHTI